MAGDGTSEPPQKKPPLSCTSCRARKLKCDKQDPCRHCVRSKTECVFPARKRIQRPRKSKNNELLQRLNRLESIVGRVGLANLEDVVEARAETTGGGARAAESQAQLPSQPQFQTEIHPAEGADSGPQGGGGEHAPCGLKGVRPPQDSTASRYMSGEFWSSLCDEVGGLRQALEQSTDSDDEDDGGEGTTPESVGGSGTGMPTSPGMLLGTPHTSRSQTIEHPLPEHIRYLASAYFRNVDMHLKILHRPTVLGALIDLADHPDTASDLSPERTALFFAIYYAAVTSLNANDCGRNLGRARGDLVTLFQAGVEASLARADYLNNTSLETLQTLTLYTCCLRSHNGSRASWALLGLPIRLAQALNMHQDGSGSNSRFSPFEAEQRRRLWWQLIVLDIRAAEDRGTGTIIARGSYDTRLPHNIDDVEFGPDTTAPLRDRPGPSDATFSLFTAQSSGIFLWSEYAQQGAAPAGSEEETIRRARHLESQFVTGADPEHVGSYLASVTVRMIILKMWLVMRYPLHPRDRKPRATAREKAPSALPSTGAGAGDVIMPDAAGPSAAGAFVAPPSSVPGSQSAAPATLAVNPHSTLRTAILIMELSDFLETGPYSDRIRWWCETYVQWHPLAVALAELCTQTQGDTVERAWQVIETVYPRWRDKIADAKRGSLWRPIRKLYKKAKAAREAALSTGGGEINRGAVGQPLAPAQSIWGTPASASISAPGPQLSGLEPAVDYMAIDPALTADSTGGIRPRLITDMILAESSARTIALESRMSYAKLSADMNAIMNRTQSPQFSPFQTPGGSTEANTQSPSFNFDSGQSMAQALFPWPDLSFDMPAAPSASGHDPVPPQTPAPAMPVTMTGEEPMLTDPALLENNMMNWSTWDEFVLDTCAADSTPKSGSGGSEGS
ncbi:fungal-specific transcription factor domain-containing protein [Nemania abortiva]|nr:fungal-specific transcription factor domain-containing protein [Nemania abortiva]